MRFLVNAYGLNGMAYEALEIYKQIPSNMTNEISHVCILNACSHAGLVEQARDIFEEIPTKTPHIITTMVRLSKITQI